MTIKKYYARCNVSTVLVFGPESVSYERSRRETAAKFHHFSARAFLKSIQKSDTHYICYISVFQDTVSEKCSCPIMCGPGPGPGPMGPAHGPGPYWALARPIHGPGPCRYGFQGANLCYFLLIVCEIVLICAKILRKSVERC